MLRLGEHVQAEHGLEQRRVAEGDDAVLLLAELEANRHRPNLRLAGAPRVKRDFDLRRANQLTGRRAGADPGGDAPDAAPLSSCRSRSALGAAPRAPTPPLLVGTVGPGFTIDLADANGKHVDILTAGQYQLLVHDLADIHNFVLGSKTTGRAHRSTEVAFVGDKTFTIEPRARPVRVRVLAALRDR